MVTSSIQLKDQLSLRIENEIRQQMDSILEKIKALANEFKIAQEDEKSPFRNVLAVAVEPSSSLEIIKNYIRYQVGRGGGASRIWSLKKGDRLFARELVDALDELSDDVGKILDRVERSLHKPQADRPDNAPQPSAEEQKLLAYLEENRKGIERSLHLELAQLYLGYLAREHTAQVGEKKTKGDQPDDKTARETESSINKPNRSDNKSSQSNRPRRRP